MIGDAVLGHAIAGDLRDARVDALVRTYRAAPAEQRPPLATTAAAATFLAGWNAPIVHGLLKHADALNGLTDLVSRAVQAGINPHPMRPGLAQAAQNGLKEAEDAWTTQQAPQHSPARPAATDPSHTTRQPPRPTGPAHDPARPDGTQNAPEL